MTFCKILSPHLTTRASTWEAWAEEDDEEEGNQAPPLETLLKCNITSRLMTQTPILHQKYILQYLQIL